MGRSPPAKERENTLKSLIAAFEKGADYVEFDVMLTKDEIPILYHDFQVCVEENGHLNGIGVHALTLEKLKTLKISGAFTTLQDVLKSAPPLLGFDIEVKYPMENEDGDFECLNIFEFNMYVDRIMDVVVKNAKDRRIIFSTFSPETCMMLRLKQNRYPVFFLTQGVTKRYPNYSNPLTKSSEIAMKFALSDGLLGVCFHSEELLRNPDLIKKAREYSLVSFVWGEDLAEKKNLEHMKALGIDGVIYDKCI